jgi:hypothetical protein
MEFYLFYHRSFPLPPTLQNFTNSEGKADQKQKNDPRPQTNHIQPQTRGKEKRKKALEGKKEGEGGATSQTIAMHPYMMRWQACTYISAMYVHTTRR